MSTNITSSRRDPKTGRVIAGMAEDPVERFWRRVKLTVDGCWEWQGAVNKVTGYGVFNKSSTAKGHAVTTHRYSYEFAFGEIMPGLDICHRCDNRKCVRPSHLFSGTAKDNMTDMARKGRSGGRKLTSEEAKAMRARVKNPFTPPRMAGDDHPYRKRPELIRRGEDAVNVRLTEAQVREIRATYRSGVRGEIQAIARRFGVNRSTISGIIYRRSWQHID